MMTIQKTNDEENSSRCSILSSAETIPYNPSEDDNLFQIDDLPSSCSVSHDNKSSRDQEEDRNQHNLDMQVRYYKPTTEPPQGLSQSVVTNDADYLRRNIMNMRTKSIMKSNNNNSEDNNFNSQQQLGSVIEEDDEKETEEDDYQEDYEHDFLYRNNDKSNDADNYYYVSNMIPSAISNKNEKRSVYSKSAPSKESSFLSSLPNFLRSIHSIIKEGSSKEDEDKYSTTSHSDINVIIDSSSPNSLYDTVTAVNQQPQNIQQEDTVVVEKGQIKNTNEHGNLQVTIEELDDGITSETLIVKEIDKPPASSPSPRSFSTTENIATASPNSQQEADSKFKEQQESQQRKAWAVVNTPTFIRRQTENDASFYQWSRLASCHYKEDSRVFFQWQPWLLDASNNLSNLMWEEMHMVPNAYQVITSNSFIFQNIIRYCFSIKVTGISKSARFKNIQDHFFSPHVVFIRYTRLLKSAHIMYRTRDEMMRAVAMYDKTMIRGEPIYCRPSFYGEIDKDNVKHSRTLSDAVVRYNRRTHNNMDKNGRKKSRRDTFIPEYHGIVQQSSGHTLPATQEEQFPYLNNGSSKAIQLTGDCQNNSINPEEAIVSSSSPTMKEIVPQHPQHKYLFRNVLPKIDMLFYHHIIVKPWCKSDVDFSQAFQYWSFCPKNIVSMNYLFHNTPYVILIFSIKSSGCYQGCALMKSEIVDLNTISVQELISTPFIELGRDFRTDVNARSWRYCCKVNWFMIKKVHIRSTGDFRNSWNRNKPARFSQDCTIIEPNLGRRIVEEFSLTH